MNEYLCGYFSPRSGPRSVRPEVYEAIQVLESQYHLSHTQASAAITVVANKLFGREKYGAWKLYHDFAVCDENTMPAASNNRRIEPEMEAMALCSIVEEMMDEKSTGENCVVLSSDGSSVSGVGAYVVQSLTVNGKPRNLPTLGVCTESRETLAELGRTVLDMMAASTNNRYSSADIMKKIKFCMTDSTSHNLKVIEKICESLEVDDVPNTLLCNVHPLMLFQRKIKDLCQMVHDEFGAKKLTECFLVDVDFKNESFVVKAIKCLTNFINRDYSAKPWNRCSHFENFIKPKKNMSLSLKDHRFNRLQDCALACLHHLEDISSYLETFPIINNGIAILDRSFVDMEILTPILATISLLGVHITRPFQALLLNKDTTYSTLVRAFKDLYQNLALSPELYLDTNHVATLVDKDMFESSLPDECLLVSLKESITEYKEDILILMRLGLKMFADGFAVQKGAIFGFGPQEKNETRTVLKISTLDAETLQT